MDHVMLLCNIIIHERGGLVNGRREKTQKELLYKMMDNRNEFDSLAVAEVFESGFRLGAMMMVSILAEK